MLIIQDKVETANPAVMRAMFEARKRVFIDLLGWDLPVLGGRYEVDRFDDSHASYLILTDGMGGHLASARLLPTTRPHLLDTLFAELCDGPPPVGDAVHEITRFCLDRRLRARERRHCRDMLVSALARYGLDRGITTYTGVAEPGWRDQILAFGWNAASLGPPRAVGGMILGALRIDITAQTPGLLAANGIAAGLDPLAEAA